MAKQFMKFSHNHAIDFSELLDFDTILITMYGGGNHCSINLDEQNIHELIVWLSLQLDKIKVKSAKLTEVKKK